MTRFDREEDMDLQRAKAEIANRMADSFLEDILGPLEVDEAVIKHRLELMQLSAAAYESMYGDKDIIF